MKIKSVEIEDFRGYKKKQKFDFELDDKITADFVAIYAPNGFGKTSFTDAIEWVFTDKISRISKNPELINLIKSGKDKQKNDNSKMYILRNIDGKNDVGRVKIVNDEDKIVELTTVKLNNKTRVDYREDNKSIKNNIILQKDECYNNLNIDEFKMTNLISSDTINSFLQFDDSKARYNILKDFWDDKNDNNIYNNIRDFHNEIIKVKQDIILKIANKNSDLKKISINIIDIEKFNERIFEFNKLSISTKLKSLDYENLLKDDIASDYILVKNQLQQYGSELNEDIEKIKSLEYENKAYKAFLFRNNELNKENIYYLKLESYLKKIETLSNKTVDEEKSITNNEIRIKKLEKLFIYRQSYENACKNIFKLEDTNLNLLTENEDILKKLPYEISIKNENNKILEKEELKKEFFLKKKAEFFLEKSEYSASVTREKYIIKSKKEILIQLDRCKDKKAKFEISMSNFKSFKNLSIHNYMEISTKNIIYDVIFQEYYKETKRLFNLYRASKDSLESLYSEMKTEEGINDRLNSIFNLGVSYIENTNSDRCPLCNTPFNKHEELKIAINNNREVTKLVLKQKKTQIKDIDTLIQKREREFTEEIDKMNLYVNKKITCYSIELRYLENFKDKLESHIRTLNYKERQAEVQADKFKELIHELNEMFKFTFDFKNIIDNERTINYKFDGIMAEMETNSKVYKAVIHNKNELITLCNAKIEGNNNMINYNKTVINKLISQPDYKYVESLLYDLNIKFDLRRVNNNIINLKGEMVNFKDNINLIEKNVIDLHCKLGKYRQTQIYSEILRIDNEIKSNNSQINIYESKYYSVFENRENSVNLNNLIERKQISTELILVNKEQINIISEAMEYLLLLNNFKEKYMIDSDINKLNEKLVKLDSREIEVSMLLNDCKEYLNDKIQEAFNVETINSIYQRIEPHPDLNSITFEPEFSDRQSKMQIHAFNKNNDIPPILYFSAAQVSLLSLSIFFARALKNKENLETIFMDDPVQHLDSINILSFIDLMRTIIINDKFKKQIILTTNNESFYKLLKLKLDKNYYKSKFIELESYGEINKGTSAN